MQAARGQEDARAGCERVRIGHCIAFQLRVHYARAFQNEDRLFVSVKVKRRLARRDEADELRDRAAAHVFVDQQAEVAVAAADGWALLLADGALRRRAAS
jgi:hypothetical protein